ncbi:hypothetical protein P4V41_08015 [Fictibacillus nanhaiensis]|uniref:hypothetical protein n=1 Tax=Fictibacillus nanhaiensis TaxID=742169 RepID=UPI002E224A54|nr:hypothetical protein [Fictibacillus nanhaiensis]
MDFKKVTEMYIDGSIGATEIGLLIKEYDKMQTRLRRLEFVKLHYKSLSEMYQDECYKWYINYHDIYKSNVDFVNNPFDLLIGILEENYSEIDFKIVIGNQLTDGKRTLGYTLFPEDGSTPLIEIHPSLSIQDATEVLAHEATHVITGEKVEHGEEWKKVFNRIHELFEEGVNERF